MPVAIADAFRNINVFQNPNTTTVSADRVGDTLTLTAGFGISISADPETDNIIITNSGNGSGALTTITNINSNATFYPIFTRAPIGTDINPNSGTFQMDTMYLDQTNVPMTYNPSTNTLSTAVFSGSLAGNADTATKLITARNINGIAFDGSANITLNSLVVGTSTVTLDNANTLTFSNGATINADTSGGITNLSTNAAGKAIMRLSVLNQKYNTVDVTPASVYLTASNWDGISSYVGTSVGLTNTAITITGATTINGNLTMSGGSITGSISGNAGTVTNGVYTTGDQTIGGNKTFSNTITGSISGNAGTVTNGFYTSSAFNLGTTSIAVNRASGAQTLTGINIDGNAATVTNGVYTSSTYYIGTTNLAFNRASGSLALTGITSIDGNAATVTNGFYTTSSFNLGTTSIAVNRTSAAQTLTGISIDGNAGTVTNGFYTTSTFNLGTTSIAINRASGSLALTGITSIDGSAASATKASNLVGGNNTTLLGSLPYQSNTDTTTLLSPNTSTSVKFLAMTGNGTNGAAPTWTDPSLSYVTTNLGAVAFTTTSWTSLGSIAIPGPGIWRVWANLRIRASGAAEFIKSGLFTSATSGTGEILNSGVAQERMLLERLAVTTGQTFFNLLLAPEWIVDMPTGLTYPYNIYIQVQSSVADAQGLNNTDANGIPTFNAVKFAVTATTGTTINAR